MSEKNLTPKAAAFAKMIIEHYPIASDGQKQNLHSSDMEKPFKHMHDHRKEREIFERSTAEKLENIKFFKEEGNKLYKEHSYEKAAYFYHKAIIYGDYTFPEEVSQQKNMEALISQSNLNYALCLIKLNNWEEVKSYLNSSLKGEEKTQKKATYWLCKYYLKAGDSKKVEEWLVKLKRFDKIESEISQIEQQLRKDEKEVLQKRKEVYSQMLK